LDRRVIVKKIINLKDPEFGELSGIKLLSNLYVSINKEGDLGIFLDNVERNPEAPNLENINFFPRKNYSMKLENGSKNILSNCVRIEINGDTDPRTIASIIELMIESNTDPYSFEDLMEAINKYRKLLKGTRNKLSDEELKGLWGELWFLKEMIYRCNSRDEIEHCLNAWKSSKNAKRDFRFPISKIIFEIKTTEKKTRSHEISSKNQLMIQTEEKAAYLVSVGVIREDSGVSHTIDSLTRIITNKINEKGLEKKLFNLLKERGWEPENKQDIALLPSIENPMALFLFEDVPTILPLPNGVSDAKWEVELNPEKEILGRKQNEIFKKALSTKDV